MISSKSECILKNDSVILKNGIVERCFLIKPAFRTTGLIFTEQGRNLVNPQTTVGMDNEVSVERSPSRETRLVIDGKSFDIGLGEGFRFAGYTTRREKDVLTLQVNLEPIFRTFKGLQLKLFYRILDGEAFIIKWLQLFNGSGKVFEVTSCEPEVLTMPAPEARWLEVFRTVYPTTHPGIHSQKQPFCYWRYDFSPEENSPIIWVDQSTKKDEFYGFTLTNDYVGLPKGCEFIFNPPTEKEPLPFYPGSIDSMGRSTPQEVRTKYPVGPKVALRPNDTFESFRTYMTLFRGGFEEGGLSIRKMVRKVCPWVNNFIADFIPTYWRESVSKKIRETGKADLRPLKHTIDQAAEVGFDAWQFSTTLWLTAPGTFEPRPEFPNGTRDMKIVADYAHTKGLKVELYLLGEVGCYPWPTSFVLNNRGHCIDLNAGKRVKFSRELLGYILKVPKGRKSGYFMCASSGWREYRQKKINSLIKEAGIDILDWDGPYYGDLCYSRKHRHRNPEESQYLNWSYQVEDYHYYLEKGVKLMAPDFLQSLFHGNHAFPTYHAETSYHKDLYKHVLRIRECLYLSTFFIPNTALKYGIWNDKNVMLHTEDLRNTDFLDYYFASVCSYGTNIYLLGEEVYTNGQNREMIKKWLDFMKEYHEILCQDIIHLAYPTGTQIDAIIHVDGKGQGLLAAFNPTDVEMIARLLIPAQYFSGVKKIETRDVRHGVSRKVILDKNFFPVDVTLRPKGYFLALVG